ncbi:maleylpyruvate isomerase N-terminal domain-containing protein [Micromonospora halophytica]|uniref:TIGR03083 family protein n=1 Tax=Micromonospora halophytica TaxID=47864 RepID=A0A1C5IKN4_9ACTN|nr:maleylpyruvate isomerase N-terminal domain-containing protein [Micromonospora halophytica]SCG58900.1 TIGR03083 family protein [Micromonospora halophytica]
MSVTPHQWQRVRTSVPAVLGRLLDLVEDAPPERAVTAHWTVADTMAHLCAVAAMGVALVRGAPPDLPVPALLELRGRTTIDTISVMNAEVLRHYRERRVPVLATRLRADVEEFLRLADEAGPEREVSWLGGARLPVAGLLAHLLNELNIHSWDVARALRRRWVIDPADAALFVDLFMVQMTRRGYGNLLDHDGPVHPGRISVTFRHRYGPEVTLAMVAGRVTVEPPDPRPDVRISFDPATFTLMLFGRVHRLRAVLSRKVSVSGRRPWLLPVFLRTMRSPS